MDREPAPLPQVRCRVMRGGQALGLAAVWAVGMGVMWGGISLGVPPQLTLPLLLVGFVVALRLLAGTATYTLEGDAVRRQWVSFAGGGARDERRSLSALRSWKHDRTLSRGFQRYEYLELDADRGPRWIITSRQDPAGFTAFHGAFRERLAALEARGIRPAQRRSFYDAWWGKSLSVGLAGSVLGLGIAAASGLVGFTALVRLVIFMVPAALYLLWRSFGPRGSVSE